MHLMILDIGVFAAQVVENRDCLAIELLGRSRTAVSGPSPRLSSQSSPARRE
jgi:hypothetical protein